MYTWDSLCHLIAAHLTVWLYAAFLSSPLLSSSCCKISSHAFLVYSLALDLPFQSVEHTSPNHCHLFSPHGQTNNLLILITSLIHTFNPIEMLL